MVCVCVWRGGCFLIMKLFPFVSGLKTIDFSCSSFSSGDRQQGCLVGLQIQPKPKCPVRIGRLAIWELIEGHHAERGSQKARGFGREGLKTG